MDDKKSDLNARFMFVQPPSERESHSGSGRMGTESEEAVGRKLEQAMKELEYAEENGGGGTCLTVVHGDVLQKAFAEVEKWILEQIGRASCRERV